MFVGNILHFNTNCDCCCDWDKQNVLKLVKIGQDKSSVQTYLQRFISCELYPHFLSLSQCSESHSDDCEYESVMMWSALYQT